MIDSILSAYKEAIFDTDRDEALRIIHSAVEKGLSPEDIMFKVVIPSLLLVEGEVNPGEEVNLAQQLIGSQIALEVADEMISKFKKKPEAVGHVIIGTAEGDLHSLGKRIVTGCLKALFLEVTDLGVNVPAESFVDKAVERHAQIIGISAMMMHTARGENGCLKVRRLLKERGLEDKIRIIVGGAPYCFDSDLYKVVQADAWARNGLEAANVVTTMIKGMQI
jgi:methanogenic corrinoid protein MtbC1